MADEQPLPEELVIQLRKPIDFAEQSYAELRLREPTAAEMLQWDRLSGVEADIKAVAVVSGLPEAVIKQVGARDLIKAGKYLAAFFVLRPLDWRERLDALGARYGRLPDEVATRRWSVLNEWCVTAGIVEIVD